MAKAYYSYDPSLPAAIIFTILFMVSAAFHAFQLVKSKTWYFVPFLVGCLFEAIGFIGRAINAEQTPDWTRAPYIAQILLLLLGPTFFAASIYMILGRLIRLLNADKHSLIRPSRLTKFFLLGDVTSIAAQGLGGIMTNDCKRGGKLANAETPDDRDQAQKIIIIGLAIQIVFFTLFMVVSCIFHYRINKKPTAKSCSINSPWQKLLLVLYASSLLILIRSIFRVVEYVTGHDGEIQSKEAYIYIFDALLMAVVAGIFNIFHPSKVLSVPGRDGPNTEGSETQLGAYGMSR